MQIQDKISPFEKCVSQMRFLLSSRFQFQIRYSLEILAEFFDVLTSDLFPQVEVLLQEFLLLRLDK